MRKPGANVVAFAATFALAALAAWLASQLARHLIAAYFMAEYGTSSIMIGPHAVAFSNACATAIWVAAPSAFGLTMWATWRWLRPRVPNGQTRGRD